MRDQLISLMSTMRRIRRRRPTRSARRLTSFVSRSTPQSVAIVRQSDMGVEWIDDPFGGNTIVALRGRICDRTLETLADDSAHWGGRTYLDLRRVLIPNRRAVEQLEMWLERLEAGGAHIHVTGISPEHPLLRA